MRAAQQLSPRRRGFSAAPPSTARPAAQSWRTGPAAVLTRYAERGVFRSFTAVPAGARRACFLLGWHRDRTFELVVDSAARVIRVPVALPNVPARSAMERAYRDFLKEFQDGSLPAHRSVDASKARLRCANRAGDIALYIDVHDGDYCYATEKLLAVVHETYLLFLLSGGYADYLIDNLGASPDWGK